MPAHWNDFDEDSEQQDLFKDRLTTKDRVWAVLSGSKPLLRAGSAIARPFTIAWNTGIFRPGIHLERAGFLAVLSTFRGFSFVVFVELGRGSSGLGSGYAAQ